MKANITQHEIKKHLRVVLAVFILVGLFLLFLLVFLLPKRYQESIANGGTNFTVLNYEGVSQKDSGKTVTPENLRKQLLALSNAGYVGVSYEQLMAFRENATPLPQKAIYLIFSDGSPETMLFANQILCQLNFKAATKSEMITKTQWNNYVKSGFWEEKNSSFTEDTGEIWLYPENNWSSSYLLTKLGENPMTGGVKGWDVLSGAIMSEGQTLILTSQIDKPAMARLEMLGRYGDWRIKLRFPKAGNGIRNIYLRADSKRDNYLCLGMEDDILIATQRIADKEDILFSRQVTDDMMEIKLSGGELSVRQKDETIAWVSTTLRSDGSIYLETIPKKGEVSDGIFELQVWRPDGTSEKEIYRIDLLHVLGNKFVRTWERVWDWLRVSL